MKTRERKLMQRRLLAADYSKSVQLRKFMKDKKLISLIGGYLFNLSALHLFTPARTEVKVVVETV